MGLLSVCDGDTGNVKRYYAYILMAVIAIFLIVQAIMAALRNDDYHSHEASLRHLAELQAKHIAGWRNELYLDARRIMAQDSLNAALADWIEHPTEEGRAATLALLHRLNIEHFYQDIVLSNAQGEVLLCASAPHQHLDQAGARLHAEVVATQLPRITDIHASEGWQNAHVGILVPVLSGGRAAGCLAFLVDCEHQLFPFLREWPLESKTTESYLVKQVGEELLYLSPLRHHSETLMRLPLLEQATSGNAAARALTEGSGIRQGLDYRKVPVLSAAVEVPDTDWVLVTEIDQAEAFMPSELEAPILILIFGMVGAGTLLAWLLVRRVQAHRELQAAFEIESRHARLGRLQAFHAEVAQLLGNPPDATTLFDTACRAATEQGGFNAAWVGVPAPDGSVVVQARHGKPRNPARQIPNPGERLHLPASHVMIRALQSEDQRAVLESDPPQAEYPCTKIALPIRSQGITYGSLNLCCDEREIAEPEAMQKLYEIACNIALMLERHDREQAHRETQQSLDENRILYDAMVHAMAEGVVVQDAEGNIVQANPAAERILGRNRSELLGHASDDAQWAAIREDGTPFEGREHPAMVTLRTGKPCASVVMGLLQRDSRRVWISINSEPLLSNDGTRPTGVVVTFHDITEQKSDRERMLQSVQRFNQLAENSRTFTWEVDLEGFYLQVDSAVELITGYTRSELVGQRHFYELHPAQGRSSFQQMTLAMLAQGKAFRDFVNPLVSKDGQVLWMSTSGIPVFGETGALMGFRGMDTDITRQRTLQQAVLDREAQFVALFENVPVSILLHDAESGEILQANSRAWQAYGLNSEEELRSSNIWNDPPYSGAEALALIQKAAQEGSQVFEWRSVRRDGSELWEIVHLNPFDYDGAKRVLSVSTDITARKQSEKQMRLQAASLEVVSNSILITDGQGLTQWVNPAFVKITGYSAAECIGKTPGSLLGSGVHGAAYFRQMWDTIRRKQPWSGEITNRRRDGGLYVEDLTITPLLDEAGEITHFIAIKQDITERKRLEAEMQQAQKMESIGRLAGGVAHDFNNILSVIQGYTELARDTLEEDHPAHEELLQVLRASIRASQLTRQLLAFSRRQVLRPEVTDINLIVSDAEKMFRRLIGEDVELIVQLGTAIPKVLADPGQIEQVIMNLVVNARDAMPTGGQISLKTHEVLLSSEQAQHLGSMPAGAAIALEIQDTGTGMAPDTLAHIFDPFFTTKEKGKGTGLGLATVYGIVKQSGGGIRVESALGKGSSFCVYLPAITDHAVETPVAKVSEPSVPYSGKILVVEDESDLLKLILSTLRNAAYSAIGVSNGEEAQALLEDPATIFDLLLTDVVMPGLSGKRVGELFLERQPWGKVIYMSGYTDDILSNHGILESNVTLLSKPFQRAALLACVHEALSATPDTRHA